MKTLTNTRLRDGTDDFVQRAAGSTHTSVTNAHAKMATARSTMTGDDAMTATVIHTT